jgi:MoaA/NifB/PqqE/SkfB family radical SAM enzyme
MRSNYKELYLFPAFCRQYGIRHLRFDFLRPDVASDEDILINPDLKAIEYLKNILPKIEEECQSSGIWFEYTLRPFLSINDGLSESPDRRGQPVRCKLPWKKIFIDASGDGAVRPDCLCEHNIGNIYANSLEEIWNGESMQLYRRRLAQGDILNWCSKACINHAVDTYQLEGGNY